MGETVAPAGAFSRMGVPELWANNMTMKDAAIFKVYKDGSERVVSVLGEVDGESKFVSKK